MPIQRMSVQDFGNTLNYVTQAMESTQGKKSSIDASTILKNIKECSNFILDNKNVKMPETVNKNIEKFLSAATVFIVNFSEKGTQEKMGSVIAALSPLTDDLQKLREGLRRRKINKTKKYGTKVEKVLKAREFKKK